MGRIIRAKGEERERAFLSELLAGGYDVADLKGNREPSMRIYRYASYEVTALRRLMGRYAVCEEEVDQPLRNEVFVDLYAIVRQGLLVPEDANSVNVFVDVDVEALRVPRGQATCPSVERVLSVTSRVMFGMASLACSSACTGVAVPPRVRAD
jgi:hypothetical protein